MPDKNKSLKILSVALLAQAVLFYGTSRGENQPTLRPLQDFTHQTGHWFMTQEGHVDEETQAVLKADDTLTRAYGNLKYRLPATLFVAYFKTQRTGKAPHSPKNCLPGAGWEPSRVDFLPVNIPGMSEPI